MPDVRVEGFTVDDESEDHLARHGVDVNAIFDLLERQHRIFRNKGGMKATHAIAGWDSRGQCLVVFIEPTPDPGIWRPVTGWYADTAHQAQSWCR